MASAIRPSTSGRPGCQRGDAAEGAVDKNARLNRLMADAMLNNAVLKDLTGKSGDARRQAVSHLLSGQWQSELRACRVIGCCRMTMR